jgi:hypothetical protein
MNQQQIEEVRTLTTVAQGIKQCQTLGYQRKYEDLLAAIEMRTDALAAMLEVVEKLPVTADGVVVPGMELHNRSGSVAGTACMALDDGDYYSPHFRDDYDNYFAPEAASAASTGGPSSDEERGGWVMGLAGYRGKVTMQMLWRSRDNWERKAQEREARIAALEAELTRCRTTEHAAAHALDGLRQHFGLDLIQGEHPADTRKRIEAELERARRREGEYREILGEVVPDNMSTDLYARIDRLLSEDGK